MYETRKSAEVASAPSMYRACGASARRFTARTARTRSTALVALSAAFSAGSHATQAGADRPPVAVNDHDEQGERREARDEDRADGLLRADPLERVELDRGDD